MDISLIKFRGYNLKNKVWLYGSLIKNRNQWFVAPDEFADGKTWDDYLIDPASVGQFTGVTDDNGKEIYSGHTVEWQDRYIKGYIKDIGVVEYDLENSRFCIEGRKGQSFIRHEYVLICGDNYKPINNN